MNTRYVSSVYDCAQPKIMCLFDRNVFQSKNNDTKGSSFVEMLQLYKDETVTTFKANAIVVHPVWDLFLNFTKMFWEYLTDQGHTLADLLPVPLLENTSRPNIAYKPVNIEKLLSSSVVLHCNGLFASAQRDDKSSKLRVLHDTLHIILPPLAPASACRFLITISWPPWKWYPTVGCYCCDALESKNMSSVKHKDTALSCVRCVTRKKDVPSLIKGTTRLEQEV